MGLTDTITDFVLGRKESVIRRDDALAFMALADNSSFSYNTEPVFLKGNDAFAFANYFKDEKKVIRSRIFLVYADNLGKFDSEIIPVSIYNNLNSIDSLVSDDSDPEKMKFVIHATVTSNIDMAQNSISEEVVVRQRSDDYRSYPVISDGSVPYREQAEDLDKQLKAKGSGLIFNIGSDVKWVESSRIPKSYDSRMFVEQEFSKAGKRMEYYSLQNPSTIGEVIALIRTESETDSLESLDKIFTKKNPYVVIAGTYSQNGEIYYLGKRGDSYLMTGLSSLHTDPFMMFKSLR